MRLNNLKADTQTQGISLIEMLITIAIISIIAGVSSVSLAQINNKSALNSASNETIHQLKLLRLKAILQKKSFQAKFQSNQFFYRNKENNQWNDWNSYSSKQHVAISLNSNITFSEKGFASPRTITLSKQAMKQKVIISLNGRIRKSEIF